MAYGKEKMKEYLLEWRKNNPDYWKEWHRNHPYYYVIHRDELRKAFSKWRNSHLDEARSRSLNWRNNNLEKDKETKRKYHASNSDRFRLTNRNWRNNNRDKVIAQKSKRRARLLDCEGSFTGEEWQNLKMSFDYTCLACHEKEPKIKLTVDHVIPITKGGSNYINNIQPLCKSCNDKKHTDIIDYRGNK